MGGERVAALQPSFEDGGGVRMAAERCRQLRQIVVQPDVVASERAQGIEDGGGEGALAVVKAGEMERE